MSTTALSRTTSPRGARDGRRRAAEEIGANRCQRRYQFILPLLRLGNENYNLYLVFGRFPAELGPENRSNVWGLKNNADRTQN